MDKSVPVDLTAERATLGSILLEREAIIAIADTLTPDDLAHVPGRRTQRGAHRRPH